NKCGLRKPSLVQEQYNHPLPSGVRPNRRQESSPRSSWHSSDFNPSELRLTHPAPMTIGSAGNRHLRLCRRPDVLIHTEEVFGIVLLFDRRQPSVISPVCGPNPVLAFFHHEIQISAACAERMQCIVISLGPFGDFLSVRWIGIHSHNYFAPYGIAMAE